MEETDENGSQKVEDSEQLEQDSDSDDTNKLLPNAEKVVDDEQDKNTEDNEEHDEDDSQQEDS